MKAIRSIIILLVTILLVIGSVGATDLSKPKGTVDNIRKAEPPKVSTTTKPSPVGQPVHEYKPKGPSVKAKPPPPPKKSYNPQNDPQVKKGWDKHQKKHGR